MTEATLEAGEARLLVEARLGREPQDMLEAAVVLEAWAGVPAQAALEAARTIMPEVPAAQQPSLGRLPRPRSQEGVLLDGAAFIVTVIAIACWAAPLASSLGVKVVEHGLMVALPLTLALQWSLRSRFLDRPHGVPQLAQHRWTLILVLVVVLALPSLVLGEAGALAGLLTITWTGGTILLRRGWPTAYVLTILLATVAMVGNLPAMAVVGAAAAITVATVAVALSSAAAAEVPPRRSLGRWERAAVAGAIGVGLGLMLVLDRTVSWTEGAVPALALLPSTVAGFLGGYHLRHLEQAIPRSLSGVSVAGRDATPRGGAPVRVLLEALGRFLLLCGSLSAALLWLSPWLGDSARGSGVLVGFALLALAGTLVGLLESMGRGRWALVVVGCAATAEATVRITDAHPFPGTGLVVAGGLAVVLALPVVLSLLQRPASTLATALWIP